VGPSLARALRHELARLERDVAAPRRVEGPDLWTLSDRQADLLDRLVDGLDLAEAASSLGIDLAMARIELRVVVQGVHRLAALEDATA